MPGLIQRNPIGLLDFLGLKATGQSPTVLPDELVATVDISQLYAAARWEQIVGTTSAVNLVGFWGTTVTTVPQNELWLVDSCAISGSTLAATTAYRLRGGLITAPGGSALYKLQEQSLSYVAGERPHIGWNNIIARGGDQLGLVVDALTLGTAITFDVRLRVLRLTV